MADFLGKGGAVGFGIESSYGTVVDATSWFPLRAGSDSINIEREDITIDDINRRSADKPNFVVGLHKVTGSLTLDAFYGDGMNEILQCATGSVKTGSGTHTWTVNDTAAAASHSLTIYVFRGEAGKCDRYAGCKINSMTISMDAGAPAEMSIDFIGRDISQGVTKAVGSMPGVPRVFAKGSAATVGLDMGFSGVAQSPVYSFSYTINNNLEERSSLNAQTILEPPFGMVEVTAEAEIEYNSDSKVLLSTDWLSTGPTVATRAVTYTAIHSATYEMILHLQSAHLVGLSGPNNTGYGASTMTAYMRGYAEDAGTTPPGKIVIKTDSI